MIHRSPYIVSAAMPDYFRRIELLYDALRDHPAIRVNPARPAANMLHLHLLVDRERALAIRAELAQQNGIWLFIRISNGELPDTS